ncbi:putative zinc finger protein 840 [Condylostylus longicornis]|uniref:putative zinc finger protein 840 n=1 Tax=Condylostylus longicornis TaxID=2530218 RepID=UPI00244E32F1|nr:putative zinc finger protein 840 [Condylostylus longicornis]XP_055370937.1 putative zinc finger protein 840 [Condylostylus longicornis]
MTESEVKTEECSDTENQLSSGKENNQSFSDGYFEESSLNSLEQCDDENYEEDSLLSTDSDETVSDRQSKTQLSDKNSKNIKNSSEEKKFGSKNNIKCGEIYWSKSSKSYLYKCSMCPTRKFMGCIALKHHHSRYHKLFDETEKKQKNILPKNKELENTSANKSKKTGSGENEKKIALEQLQSLFKRKIITNQCYKCRKKFESDQELVEHSKIHVKKNSLNCIYCKETFTRPEEFKKHQLSHKRFTCKFCGKAFAHNGNKKQHERLHNETGNSSKIHEKSKTTKTKVKVLK